VPSKPYHGWKEVNTMRHTSFPLIGGEDEDGNNDHE